MRGRAALLILFLTTTDAMRGQSLGDAAADLARQIASWSGSREPLVLGVRNRSSAGAAEFAAVSAALEAGLRGGEVRTVERGAEQEARVTLSEAPGRYLLIAELRRGEERAVVFAAAPKSRGAGEKAFAMTLEKALVWEEEAPILDAAVQEPVLLVLEPERIALYRRGPGGWEPVEAVPIAARSWPRDLRGRLKLSGNAFQAYLPGVACGGAIQPALSVECRASDEGWPLESGNRLLGLANFTAGRNYFAGRVVTAPGGPRNFPPFFSAAALGGAWLLAGLDGRTRLYDAALEPAVVERWGSGLAGVETPCAGGGQVLATRASDADQPDAVQAYEIVSREPVAASAPVDFPGPVTALWPTGSTTALAVVRNSASGRYAAYRLSVACAP